MSAVGGGKTRSTLGVDEEGARAGAEGAVLLVAGEGRLATHRLSRRELTIGRGDDCEIVVASPTLSRRHARLCLGPPLTVQDLGSRNGTRVAGRLVYGGAPVPLAPGDAFHVGRYSCLVIGPAHPASGAISDAAQLLRVADPTPAGATALVRDIAASAVNVLVLGETGTGKEVLANTLHQLSGRSGPLVGVNCAALSPTLLESELFGHEKGAFTGASEAKAGLLAAARGGTVLLDEVGELPLALQAKLLRAIDTREVLRVGGHRPQPIDVRFVAATNRDLPAEVARGQFRADLYFRLDGVTLELVPLRERRWQVASLALGFLADAGRGNGGAPAALSAAVLTRLAEHDWPGNVRELKAVIERARLLARGGEIGPAHLQLRTLVTPAASALEPAVSGDERARPGAEVVAPDDAELRERARILAALEACAGNQTRAARQLGISRATLVHKLAVHRIPRPRK